MTNLQSATESGTDIRTTTTLSMDEVDAHLRKALALEGFGVLTEIDVQATLEAKLGVQTEPYRILGACHPGLAHRAISLWKGFGLFAPCNVAIYDAGELRVVIAFDPSAQPEARRQPELYDIARDAASRLRRAVASLPA